MIEILAEASAGGSSSFLSRLLPFPTSLASVPVPAFITLASIIRDGATYHCALAITWVKSECQSPTRLLALACVLCTVQDSN